MSSSRSISNFANGNTESLRPIFSRHAAIEVALSNTIIDGFKNTAFLRDARDQMEFFLESSWHVDRGVCMFVSKQRVAQVQGNLVPNRRLLKDGLRLRCELIEAVDNSGMSSLWRIKRA